MAIRVRAISSGRVRLGINTGKGLRLVKGLDSKSRNSQGKLCWLLRLLNSAPEGQSLFIAEGYKDPPVAFREVDICSGTPITQGRV